MTRAKRLGQKAQNAATAMNLLRERAKKAAKKRKTSLLGMNPRMILTPCLFAYLGISSLTMNSRLFPIGYLRSCVCVCVCVCACVRACVCVCA